MWHAPLYVPPGLGHIGPIGISSLIHIISITNKTFAWEFQFENSCFAISFDEWLCAMPSFEVCVWFDAWYLSRYVDVNWWNLMLIFIIFMLIINLWFFIHLLCPQFTHSVPFICRHCRTCTCTLVQLYNVYTRYSEQVGRCDSTRERERERYILSDCTEWKWEVCMATPLPHSSGAASVCVCVCLDYFAMSPKWRQT